MSESLHAEIITIGTELLLGEIVDTNTTTIARALRGIGLDLFHTSTVGDNAERIAQAVREGLERSQVVITSGGLGPTVDDATREGIALALDVPTEFHPELWEHIQELFARYGRTPTQNNRRQALLPSGALPVHNPVGTAPAFIVETEGACVVALPGVPAELTTILQESILPYLRERLDLHHVILTRIVRTAGVGESFIDDGIQDLEHLKNPTVGLAAHAGRVDIRITAKAEDNKEALRMIAELEGTLRERLGDVIYGTDDESLESVVLRMLEQRAWRLVIVESGTAGALGQALASLKGFFCAGLILPHQTPETEVEEALHAAMQRHAAEIGLGLTLSPQDRQQQLVCRLVTPEINERLLRSFGGPPKNAPRWAASLGLNLIRKRLSQ
ncbi:MAG TPA: CinA family nicotinamide mononucleotide deamidase-related protein [Anaerolineae bacterium]|nr:CinA family nicotinamide mononucleotide deamidase-related protein [Anaerolineae bacterium]